MIPQEEPCPVSDALLGDLYRATPERLRTLTESIPSAVRAKLAFYCHGRSHLAKIGLAMTEGYDKTYGPGVATFFEQAFRPEISHERRRKVTLSSGPLMHVAPDEDLAS